MQIGQLDRRIMLEMPAKVANSYGEQTLTWSDYREVWAMVEWNGGKEQEETQRITATSKLHFYIRNIETSVNTEYRVLYKTKYYYIKVINEIDGRDKFLELITEQKD